MVNYSNKISVRNAFVSPSNKLNLLIEACSHTYKAKNSQFCYPGHLYDVSVRTSDPCEPKARAPDCSRESLHF